MVLCLSFDNRVCNTDGLITALFGINNIQLVLLNNMNSNVCAVQKETEFHTSELDRRGTVAVLCILEDIIQMELKKFRVGHCGK